MGLNKVCELVEALTLRHEVKLILVAVLEL